MVTKTPKTRAELHASAVALAQQYQLVKHNSQLFVPVNWFLPVVDATLPDPLETVWLPMSAEDILEFGNNMGLILFQNMSEYTSFKFMLTQESARPSTLHTDQLFVKTEAGLRVLDKDGELVDPTGEFVPNMLWPKLNTDESVKAEVMAVLVDWLGDEEPVHSLLHHIATALAPGWSAAKIVLLLGAGRNGKSTLLKMVEKLLGAPNVSHVTRQQMASRETAIIDLNNKLANIVYDGEATYLKDSSTEKTLVVGEKVGVRLLYENNNTDVWTNGLFLEGLNDEPKSRDKTNALQRRLVRFWFPKEYPLNKDFEEHMLTEEILGAFLSLLLDHYVKQGEHEKLAPSQASYDLQVDQLWVNSKTFQFLKERSAVADKFIGMEAEVLAQQFHAWLLTGKDDYSGVDAYRMLKECFVLKRKSVRIGTLVKKVYVVDSFTPDAQRMIEMVTEGETDEPGVLDDSALVED